METSINIFNFKEDELSIINRFDTDGNNVKEVFASLYNYKGQPVRVPESYIDKDANVLSESEIDKAVEITHASLPVIFGQIGRLLQNYVNVELAADSKSFVYIVLREDNPCVLGIIVSSNEMVKTKADLEPISLTEDASKELADIFQKYKMPETACFRIGVKGSDSNGLKYIIQVLDYPNKEDILFESHGIKVTCHKNNFPYLKGAIIDWDSDVGFIVDNPNESKSDENE